MAIDIFILCAQDDQTLCAGLSTHLANLRNQQIININPWDEDKADIIPGMPRTDDFLKPLAQAQIILLLISPNFMASDFYNSVEMHKVIARDKAKSARVVPIVLRPTDYVDAPFAKLLMLPTDAKPVTRWDDRDEAFTDIVKGIRKVIADLTQNPLIIPGPISHQAQQVSIMDVPLLRNPHFGERNETLKSLHDMLTRSSRALPHVAISGLGGIGKTQIALEYLYLHSNEYQYVLWVQCSSRLAAPLNKLASTLDASVTGARNLPHLIAAIERWLREHREWLLVLDDIDDLTTLSPLLRLDGHILLTTRSQSINETAQDANVQLLELDGMSLEEGTQFLLHRSRPTATPASFTQAEREAAQAIVTRLGGLPSALDKVGYYIESRRISLPDYNERYHRDEERWLQKAYRLTAPTWQSSFKGVKLADPAAYDLLRLCAFLHHSTIPERMLKHSEDDLPSALRQRIENEFDFDEVIGTLFRYSLVHREEGILTMQPLVQMALRDSLSLQEQQAWAERAVSLVNQVFPFANDHNQQTCEHYLQHALVCAKLIARYDLIMLDAAHLLDKLGYYFSHCEQHDAAHKYYTQALWIYERDQQLGENTLATSLELMAAFCQANDKHEEADDLRLRALRIREQNLGQDHPHIVDLLYNYSMALQKANEHALAQAILARREAIQIRKRGVQT